MTRLSDNIWVARVTMFMIGLVLVVGGAGASLKGPFHYQNYWGGLVFAPLAAVGGIFIWVTLVVHWKTLNQHIPRAPKLKGRAARRARQAEKTKFPIDSFRKW